MEKYESIPAVIDEDEDFLIDLGAASVETKGVEGPTQNEPEYYNPMSALTE